MSLISLVCICLQARIFSCMLLKCLSRSAHHNEKRGAKATVRATTKTMRLEYEQQDASEGHAVMIESLERLLGTAPRTALCHGTNRYCIDVSFPADRTSSKTYDFKSLVKLALGEEEVGIQFSLHIHKDSYFSFLVTRWHV